MKSVNGNLLAGKIIVQATEYQFAGGIAVRAFLHHVFSCPLEKGPPFFENINCQ